MEREQRRLAAIVAMDVVGYSRLMGVDESDTLGRLKAHRAEAIDPAIARYGGRIVKTTGDGLLLEFASVVDAVRSALEIQKDMAARNADVPKDKLIAFRMGVHVGDVIVEDTDIFGDGVNIAARLEGLASQGGICLSQAAHDAVRGKVEASFDDLGEQSLKNIERPVRVYHTGGAMAARETRHLAAVLLADVVGFSRMVTADEPGALAQLADQRRDLIDPAMRRHSGRLVKTLADAVLIEFPSAARAVACAVEIQDARPLLPLRIGIHLGDVIEHGNDLFGHGVNVAARLEGVAETGGIAISRSAYEAVRDRADLGFEDKGEIDLGKQVGPVHVFARPASSPATPIEPAPTLALPDKPSIAVLPFQNMSGDPEQDYFVDGLVEDIITALSRNRGLFVIARNSSFTYKGRSVDVRQVGRELGIRYVLEGSVRKAANKVRITGQLIDGETGSHLWADRFDGSLENIFELQDQVANRVASIIRPAVERAEIERAVRKTTNLQAYDFFLRATAASYRLTPKDLDEALGLAEQARALDPSIARYHALIAQIHNQRNISSFSSDPAADAAAADRAGRKALSLDANDAGVLTTYGMVLMFSLGRHTDALPLFDKAIDLDPNLAAAWIFRAMAKRRPGRDEEAIKDFEYALRLSPRDPLRWAAQHGLAWRYLMTRRYGDAIASAALVLQSQPDYGPTLRVAIAANALAGRADAARAVLERHMALEPKARISSLRETYLRRVTPEAFEILADGLRKAGFSE